MYIIFNLGPRSVFFLSNLALTKTKVFFNMGLNSFANRALESLHHPVGTVYKAESRIRQIKKSFPGNKF